MLRPHSSMIIDTHRTGLAHLVSKQQGVYQLVCLSCRLCGTGPSRYLMLARPAGFGLELGARIILSFEDCLFGALSRYLNIVVCRLILGISYWQTLRVRYFLTTLFKRELIKFALDPSGLVVSLDLLMQVSVLRRLL